MSDYKLTPNESDILKVIKNEIDFAKKTPTLKPTINALDSNITSSEDLLRSLGLGDELEKIKTNTNSSILVKPVEKKIITVGCRKFCLTFTVITLTSV